MAVAALPTAGASWSGFHCRALVPPLLLSAFFSALLAARSVMVFPFFRLVAKEELGLGAHNSSIPLSLAAEVNARATVLRSTSQIIELVVQTVMLPTLGPLSDSLG